MLTNEVSLNIYTACYFTWDISFSWILTPGKNGHEISG